MNISDIQQHVTYFSEELRHKAKHEEEVVVGGKITSIIPPVNDEYPMYIVMADDLIGTVHIMVPDTMMDAHLDNFQIGNFIFVEGFVNIITRTDKKETKKDISIFAFSMKDITKVGDTSK
jgi:hypothetical protein